MPASLSYNRIAGQNLDRLAALSDGIFAVAMTLLVFDLKVPQASSVHSEAALARQLLHLAPRFATFVLSFLTLGIFWIGQQTQINHLIRSERHLTWLHLAFLFAVTLVPFSTRLIADFITLRLALILYWLNILLLGALLYAAWRLARHYALVDPTLDVAVICSIERRIIVAQLLYAVGAGLCAVNVGLSIGFIILVQANYAVAPARGWLGQL